MSNKIDLDTPIVVNEILLEKIQYRAGIALGASVLRDATVSIEELPMFDQVFLDLQTKLLTQEICQDTYRVSDVKRVNYPSSWWQHFKQDKMPKWFIKRYPVHYNTETVRFSKDVKITRRETYPMSSLAIQNNKEFIKIMGSPVVKDEVRFS